MIDNTAHICYNYSDIDCIYERKRSPDASGASVVGSEMVYNDIKHVIGHFDFKGLYRDSGEITSGNINSTYRLIYESEGKTNEYILQRINTVAFHDPERLMRNIKLVSEHIAKKISAEGGDPARQMLNYIKADNGTYLWRDAKNEYWRADIFIGDATAYDSIEKPEHFYEAGRGFGKFQKNLFDFPADMLTETIPDFHNTKKRFYAFVASVATDSAGRVSGITPEIDFLFDRRKMMSSIVDKLADGTLPLRVTHNDTKLNNVLIDNRTGKALCVIDLDTVMPGSSLYDYGDAVRYGASTAAEDESDRPKIHIDMKLFKLFTKGFVEETKGFLTPDEIHYLPLGIKVITCELAMRFLTDYIDGDLYFKVRYPGHNLVRARSQMTLLTEIEKYFDEMTECVDSLI